MRTDILQQARDIRDSMDAAAIALTDEQAETLKRHEFVGYYFAEVS